MRWISPASLQRLLPQRLLSALIYRIARSANPVVKNALINWFVNHYPVDLKEAAECDLSRYPTFNAFFTRRLRPKARALAGNEKTLICPVDGRITAFGTIKYGQLIQAKAIEYPLDALLGENTAEVQPFVGGYFATFYLAPHNYHRIHMPVAGRLTRTRYIPGRRLSLNPESTKSIQKLFCRNERVVCWFDTAIGPLALVLVGALNVSSISTQWLGEIKSGNTSLWENSNLREHFYKRGDEIAQFNLGSTVIAVCPPCNLLWHKQLNPNIEVRMGGPLASIVNAYTR
ncbi:MAG: archaetidylserine decarboxylase [Gammaproteobacteria bacterium]